ncbi:MAG: response regulator [Defluviitaleaceae bacterium]|nr:response regulator [Defluviitaleaceae bacterium]
MKKTVFVVDDCMSSLKMSTDVLYPHYTIVPIPSGEKAIALLEKVKPDIILLDIAMPKMNGFDVLKYLKSNDNYKDIPVIFLTAKSDHQTEIDALEMGVVDFITKPFNSAVLLNRVKHHIDINNLVRERTSQLHSAKQDIVFVLADMVENRDESTGDHLGRTSRLVKTLLDSMLEKNIYYDHIKNWDFSLMAECSLLHDVGKINTPDAILKKPGKLTNEEFEIMKTHALIGAEIIEKIIARSGENVFLNNAKIFALYHHERWNGTGYPYGIQGEDIPLQGRIMAIVDACDALMSKRAYKEAFSADQSFEIIAGEKGKHFDPNIVDIFYDIKDDICQNIYQQ